MEKRKKSYPPSEFGFSGFAPPRTQRIPNYVFETEEYISYLLHSKSVVKDVPSIVVNVPGAYRYKAGFCLQRGQAKSWLTYERAHWNKDRGYCEGDRVLHIVWGAESLLFGEKWSAPTYLVYLHWNVDGEWGRNYSHFGGSGIGDLFDWGQRYSWKPCRYFD